MYPTAICKVCGEKIYGSKGLVDKKGCWTCVECLEKPQKETKRL